MSKLFNFNSVSGDADTEKVRPKSVGKLKGLGVTDFSLLPFLLPKKYHDIRKSNIIMDYQELADKLDKQVYIACRMHGKPQALYEHGKPPRTRFLVKDSKGHVLDISIFGPPQALVPVLLKQKSFCLKLTVGEWNGQLSPRNVEYIPSRWIGKIRPTYPGKTKTINPETVLEKMTSLIDFCMDDAIQLLRDRFSITDAKQEAALIKSLEMGEYDDFYALIKAVHAPATIEAGRTAQAALKRLAVMDLLSKINAQAPVINEASAIPVTQAIIDQLFKDMPKDKSPTEDQLVAIREIIADIQDNKPMHRLLTGDVGTGKSIPIAIAAAAMARMGLNAVILMPNEALSEQMRADIEAWWPDTQPKLVSSSVKKLPSSHILVGTTALNFKVPDDYPVNLLIIDEQQRMSVGQRLKLARPDTNILEASATPLPRSLALVNYGGLPLSVLHKAYVEKNITTSIVKNTRETKQALFNDVKRVIAEGYQALIVYPLAETAEVVDEDGEITVEALTEKQKIADLKSAEGAFAAWERNFPGRVRFAHGRLKNNEKLDNINALKNDQADILCSTTVVEVGLNIPKLRYVVVVHPERLGLSALHQLRGRLCRNGGDGYCALYLPDDIKDKAMKRLEVFESTTDGFKIALEDMRARGMGDVGQSANDEQSGFLEASFLPGQKLSLEDFDWAIKASQDTKHNEDEGDTLKL